MGTIADELTRIQTAKADLKTSIENKGVQVPANTLIDGYPALVDQISGGGGSEIVDAVDNLTNVDYMCMGCSEGLNDTRIALMRAMLHHLTRCTSMKHTFQANDRRIAAKCAEELHDADLSNINDFTDAFYDMRDGNAGEVIIDLRGLKFVGRCAEVFASGANTRPSYDTIIKFDKDTFEGATNVQYLFYRTGTGLILDYYNDVNEISLVNSISLENIFGLSRIKEYRFNGVQNKILNIKVSDLCTTIEKMFNFNVNSNFLSHLDEVNFIGDTSGITSYFNAFSNGGSSYSTLKKISGLNFENATNMEIMNDGSTYSYVFPELTDFTVVNGTSLSKTGGNINLVKIWRGNASTTKNGHTMGYWFEQFANSLGPKQYSGTQTIFIYRSLYNSLSETQKALITDKGYALADGGNY